MDSQIVALRRRNLRKWIDDEFGGVQAKFIAVTEINQGEVSSLPFKHRRHQVKRHRNTIWFKQ